MKEEQITFKNLPFLVKHFGGINAVYEFKNGWKLSVSAGEFPYSYPRENFGNPEGYSSFEVAVIDNNQQIVGSIDPAKIINTVFGGRKKNN